MASYDADPLFLKGLRLLHSKAKDSADQLRQLLEDVLSQKYTPGGVPNHNLFANKEIKGHIALHKQVKDYETKGTGSKKTSPKHSNESSSQSSKSNATIIDEPKKKEAEKRQFEKLKQELADLCYERKRSKTTDSSHSSLSSSPSPQPTIKTEEYSSSTLGTNLGKIDTVDSGTVLNSAETGGPGDAEDFAMEMGLACVVCSKLEVTPRNRMIECQECHSLYHQECHRPSVTDNEVNDPRHVWYCVRCTKSMRKASKSQKNVKTTASSPVTIREPITPTKSFKTVDLPAPSLPSLLPFKRSEIKASSASHGSISGHSSSIAAVNKPIGLAGLAANFNARTTTPSSVSSSSSLMASKSNFGSTKGGLSSLATSKSASSFPSQPPSAKSGKSFSSMSGLASLASAAAVVAKSSANSSRSTVNASGSSSGSSGAGNGGNGASSVSGKSSASSSLMSADKRLQIMKKKAAAKMQEKRRLSSK